ncbi:MAG: IPT/TIG domain-containing protein, partial [Planctomycetota bacterium]
MNQSYVLRRRFCAQALLLITLGIAGCSGGGGGGGSTAPPPGVPPVDNAPEAQLAALVGVLTGDIALVINVIDSDTDAVNLALSFSIDGGASFVALSLTPTSPSPNGLVADADGESYTFLWDSTAAGVGTAAIASQVRVRVIPSNARTGPEVLSGVFSIDNVPPPSAQLSVTSVTPSFGPGGTLVTIEGFNFGDDPQALTVRFGSESMRIASLVSSATPDPLGFASTVVVITSPEAIGGAVEIVRAGSSLLTPIIFRAAPRVEEVAPAVISAVGGGASIVLRGAQLDVAPVTVRFLANGQDLSVAPSAIAPDLLQVAFPVGLTPAPGGSIVDIEVVTAGGPGNRVQLFLAPGAGVPLPMPPGVTRATVPMRAAVAIVPIRFRLFDTVGTDLANWNVEYSENGGVFQSCTQAAIAPLVASLGTSSVDGGMEHIFLWDAGSDLSPDFHRQIRMRVESFSTIGAIGAAWTSPPLWLSGEATTSFVEEFDSTARQDAAATTADWNHALGTPFGAAGKLVGLAEAAPESPWGDGSDGVFAPASSVTLTTDGVDPVYGGLDGVYRFSSFMLPSGAVLTASGSNALDIRVLGTVTIAGEIQVSGANGGVGSLFAAGSGGAGGPGASAGGAGGAVVAGIAVNGVAGGRGG